MKRLALPFLLALLSASMAVPSCAGKFPDDIWPALKACGTNDVSWGAASEVFADLVEIVNGNPAGTTDLLALLAADVGGGIPCLVNYFETQGGQTGAAAAKFKAGHAKELKAAAARGPSACRSPVGARPAVATLESVHAAEATLLRGRSIAQLSSVELTAFFSLLQVESSLVSKELRTSAALSYAYPGETVAAAADRCELACGSESSLSTPGAACSCWRVDKKNWRNSRWVSAPASLAVAAR